MSDLKGKHEIEAALASDLQQVSSGLLKEDNPLDISETFRVFCEACRRGDLKVCQEKIQEGVNINARDRFDYTPLILVSSRCSQPGSRLFFPPIALYCISDLDHTLLTAYHQGQSMRSLRSLSTPSRVRRPLRTRHLPGRTMPV